MSYGSWSIAPGLPGNASTTAEAYLALKILRVLIDDHAMFHCLIRADKLGYHEITSVEILCMFLEVLRDLLSSGMVTKR